MSGFELVGGQVTAVFGPNGAGKTTLIRRLAREHIERVAYQPQHPYLFRGLAGENLGLGLDAERAALAGQYARRFGLGPVLAEPAEQLSGGERSRLVLARVLARPDPLLLLDEPLATIDLVDRAVLQRTIREAASGRTAVVVTHELEDVVGVGDRLAVLIDGDVVQQGSVAEVMAHPSTEQVGRAIGVSNVLDGEVGSVGSSTVEVLVGGVRFVGHGEGEPGRPARVLVPAETVTLLTAGSPDAGSARNLWPGVVRSLEPRGRLVEVIVDIGVELAAIVTPGSIDALGLTVGSGVGVAVKAASIRVVDR